MHKVFAGFACVFATTALIIVVLTPKPHAQAIGTTETTDKAAFISFAPLEHQTIWFGDDRAELTKQFDRVCWQQKCVQLSAVLDLIEQDGQ